MKISIIVPVFNGEKYIGRCLDSIINQTYKNIEIIVVNDFSNDNTTNVLNKYRNFVVIIDNYRNMGVSYSRNKGIKESTGDFITFLDSDDYYNKNDYIEKSLEYINEMSLDILKTSYYIYEKNKLIESNPFQLCNELLTFDDIKQYFLENNHFNNVWSSFFRMSIIKNNKIIFNEKLIFEEDALFSMNACKEANIIGYMNYSGYVYYYNNDGVTKNYNVDKSLLAIESILNANLIISTYYSDKSSLTFKVFNKINHRLKNMIYSSNISYKDFCKVCEKIYSINAYTELSKYLKKINKISLSNKILINLLFKKKLFLYYYIVFLYKKISR